MLKRHLELFPTPLCCSYILSLHHDIQITITIAVTTTQYIIHLSPSSLPPTLHKPTQPNLLQTNFTPIRSSRKNQSPLQIIRLHLLICPSPRIKPNPPQSLRIKSLTLKK